MENLEGSRQDLHRISATNKSAVQGIPSLMSQQYRAAKDHFESELAKVQSLCNQKLADNTQEMLRMRARIIEIIDEKTRLEGESAKLAMEKREAKSHSD